MSINLRFFLVSVMALMPYMTATAQAPQLPPVSDTAVGVIMTEAEVESMESESFRRWLTESVYDVYGFMEMRAGWRLRDDSEHDRLSIGEVRMQLKTSWDTGPIYWSAAADMLYDHVYNHLGVDLENGHGVIDLREFNVQFTPFDFMDIKAGRQVLTWGTGDLVFINDLFPKDWNSFFIGRDDEYLKAPSDAVKVSFYGGEMPNLDIVYVPRFDADRFVDGSRLSFWNLNLQRHSGGDDIIEVDGLREWLEDDEWALRMFKNIGGYELAVYGYTGFWKSPAGTDPVAGKYIFPALDVYGTSVRGAFASGIAHAEFGYYDSKDDRNGDDPFVANSEMRVLVGYERELARDLTGAVQYYLTCMRDYDLYRVNLPAGVRPENDEFNHSLTLRLTQSLMRQNLVVSCYARWSITESDAYIRPEIYYKIDDDWTVEVGGNLFTGRREYTFLNQFAENNNVYFAVRRLF